MARAWAQHELEILQHDNEDRVPREVTAGKLGKSPGAVKQKLAQQGVRYPQETGTEREDRKLRERWRRKLPAMRAAVRRAVEQSSLTI